MRTVMMAGVVGLLALTLAALGGCKEKGQDKPTSWDAPKAPITPRLERPQETAVPVQEGYDPAATYEAEVETDLGKFVLGFYPGETPGTVRNFVELAMNRFYEEMIFHRVVANDLVQTGDPKGTGIGGSEQSIKGEFTPRHFVAGTVGMARRAQPDSASSQWFVALKPMPQWDGKYSAFGYVKSGLDVVRKISQSPVFGANAVDPSLQQRPVTPPKLISVKITKVSSGPTAVEALSTVPSAVAPVAPSAPPAK